MAGGTTYLYKVQFHFESGGKKISPEYSEWISAADSTFNTIQTVLTNNSKIRGAGTLVIDAVINPPAGSYAALIA